MIPKDDELEKIITKLIKKIGNWGNTASIDDYEGDLNDIAQTGFVMTSSDTTNTPYTDCWYVLTFVKNPAYYLLQIAFLRNNPNVIYVRTKNDYTIWSDWSPIKQNITTGVEFKTGRIIDGKEEYGKRINLGQLPNTSEKAVAHGINLPNINITYFDAYCLQGDNDLVYRLPHIGSEEKYNISIWLDSSNINIKTFSNRTAYTGYATLYYTQK